MENKACMKNRWQWYGTVALLKTNTYQPGAEWSSQGKLVMHLAF